MTEEQAFIEAIQENPDDDAPRLVFADWLDEHGAPGKAEFLRLAVAAVRAPTPNQVERLRELRLRVGTDWIGEVLSPRFDSLLATLSQPSAPNPPSDPSPPGVGYPPPLSPEEARRITEERLRLSGDTTGLIMLQIMTGELDPISSPPNKKIAYPKRGSS